MVTLLILHSDPKWYGNLVNDIMNEHTCGADGYPDTLARAYSYLTNYCSGHPPCQFQEQDGGLAFAQLDDATDQGG